MSNIVTEQEFEQIIKENQQAVYSVVFGFLKNAAETEEIVQSTFVKAYKGIKNFCNKSSIRTWLIRIAINNVKNYYRKKKFLSIFSYSADDEVYSEPIDTGSDIEDNVSRRMLMNKINKAIERLPERQREVFVMKHFNGMSISEIGAILSISAGSVKANIFKAVRNLRKYLEDAADEMY